MMKPCRYDGFTLFEIVIAVAIFSVIGVLAMPAISKMTRDGIYIRESNQNMTDLQFALGYLAKDWTQVTTRKIRNRYGDVETNIVIEENHLKFTRKGWQNLLGAQRSELQRVEYLVEDKKLVRRFWMALDQPVGAEPISQTLLSNIEDFQVRFLNGEEEAIDEWPTVQANRVGSPIVLSIVVDIAGLGKIERIMEIPGGAI